MYIAFDLETQKIFDEINGGKISDLGISYLAYYRSDTDKIEGLFENDIFKFKEIMDRAEFIVGYNIIDFDIPVLKGSFEINEKNYNLIDLYQIIHKQCGVYLKLDNITSTTLGAGKIAHGLDAIRFYREGNFDKLKEYCDSDVQLTNDIYKYILENGYCYYTDGLGNKVKLEVKIDINSSASNSQAADTSFGGLF